MARAKIAEFGIIQKALAQAVVTFYAADADGNNTGVKATIYAASTGSGQVENPQTLGDNGMLPMDCWVESQIVAAITGITERTERSIKKIKQNPLEFALPVTNAAVYALDLQVAVTDAEAARDAAQISATNAADSEVQTGLDAVATAADRIATGNDATATAADRVQTGLDRTAAENAAAAAASSAAEGLYNDVITLTSADSPYVPSLAQEGTMFRLDMTSGAITINLSALSVYGEDMKFAFVKVDATGNAATINRGGTDTIEGNTSASLSIQYESNVFVGDSATGMWIDVVQSTGIADGSVTNAKIADNAVTTAKINNSAVTTDKINNDAVTLAKMAAGTAGNLITYDASGNPAAVATGTAGQVLTSNGAGAAPTMQDAAAGGKLINRWVATYTGNAALSTIIPNDNTVPQNTEGTEILSTSVQQSAAGNIMRFTFIGSASITRTGSAGAEYDGLVTLFTDLSSDAVQAGVCNGWLATIGVYSRAQTIGFIHEMSFGDTAAHTVSVRAGPGISSSSMRFNYQISGALFGGAMSAVLIIEEIEP